MSDWQRYPLDALAVAIGCTPHQVCVRLGVSGTTEKDYRGRGVTERVADRLAVKAGLHSFEVWPELADHQVERADADRRTRIRSEKRRYRSRNRAAVDAYQAAYREANRDALRAHSRSYYRRNRAALLERQRIIDRRRRATASGL